MLPPLTSNEVVGLSSKKGWNTQPRRGTAGYLDIKSLHIVQAPGLGIKNTCSFTSPLLINHFIPFPHKSSLPHHLTVSTTLGPIDQERTSARVIPFTSAEKDLSQTGSCPAGPVNHALNLTGPHSNTNYMVDCRSLFAVPQKLPYWISIQPPTVPKKRYCTKAWRPHSSFMHFERFFCRGAQLRTAFRPLIHQNILLFHTQHRVRALAGSNMTCCFQIKVRCLVRRLKVLASYPSWTQISQFQRKTLIPVDTTQIL